MKSSQPGGSVLPKWIKTSEKRFNETLKTVTEAKNNGLKISVGGREITLDKAESLLKDVGSGKINRHEFKEKYNDIIDDVIPILDKSAFTRNEQNMIEILSLLKEIIKFKDKKTNEQPGTTDIPELKSEESAEQRRLKSFNTKPNAL